MSLRDWPILRQLSPDFFASIRLAFVFGQTGNEALLIVSDGKMYGIGANFTSCLGVGDSNHRPEPTEIVDLAHTKIKGLACGGIVSSGIFVIAFSDNGEIYQWGSLAWESSGCSNYEENYVATPQKINIGFNVKVSTIACGYFHCMILSDDGKVFSWGNNDCGQLGHSENSTVDHYNYFVTNTPCQVKGIIEGKTVIEIACGGEFSVVLLNDGKVLTWGSNEFGQLGSNSTASSSSRPVRVSALNNMNIKKIACGSNHVLALSQTNVLYGWGNNSSLQLGLSILDNNNITHYPKPVNLSKIICFSQSKIIDIGASYACDLSVVQCGAGKEVFMLGKITGDKILSVPTDSQCESIDQVFAFYASPNMMPKPMRHILEAKRRSTILQTLESQFGNQATSDLTIVVDENEIYVHLAILRMRSEFFRTMLDAHWFQKDEKVVTIKEKSFIVMSTYLKYLYTDTLEVDLDLAVELLLLADEYGDDNFKSLFKSSIKRDMKAEWK
ncbi:hypothetical protein V9T40_005940 [Parthenolecanium corni]|uniref:BTB domain-containing protein n=1 Tax=Parthenolecanium corni TaxID=536013 RepID=A0AAN9U2L1_9HEMI